MKENNKQIEKYTVRDLAQTLFDLEHTRLTNQTVAEPTDGGETVAIGDNPAGYFAKGGLVLVPLSEDELLHEILKEIKKREKQYPTFKPRFDVIYQDILVEYEVEEFGEDLY